MKNNSPKSPRPQEPKPHGGRNLIFLGLGAITIAVITTIVSLVIYHNSGDIYLDRSRPGFLPEEAEEKASSKYVYPDTGAITKDSLEEYIKELKSQMELLDELDTPFIDTPLSDESLGI